MSFPPAGWLTHAQRSALSFLTVLTLTFVLLPLAGCGGAPPARRATASSALPSATPASPPTVYVGLAYDGMTTDRRYGALIALRADSGGVRWLASLDAVGGTSQGATLANGVIYAASRDVFAVARRDGTLLWHTPLAGLAGEPLTLADGVLFVPRLGYTVGDASSHQVEHVDPSVYAVRARDGAILWHSQVVAGQVVVNQGIVYGRSSDMTQLLALRASDGAALWRTSLGGGLVSTPALVGDTLYATTLTGDVAALRMADGSIRWEERLADSIAGAVAVSDGAVYAALIFLPKNQDVPIDNTTNALVALRASNGVQLWRVPNDERHLGTPAVANGVLYVSDGDGFSARRASNGALLWHARGADVAPALSASGPQQFVFATTPVVANGRLFAVVSVSYFPRGGASVIVALDTRTGAARWRYPQDDKLPGFVGSLVAGL